MLRSFDIDTNSAWRSISTLVSVPFRMYVFSSYVILFVYGQHIFIAGLYHPHKIPRHTQPDNNFISGTLYLPALGSL